MKKLLSVLLTIIMLAGMLPAGAVELPETGKKTPDENELLIRQDRTEESRTAQPHASRPSDLDDMPYWLSETYKETVRKRFDYFQRVDPEIFLLNDEGIRKKAALDTVTDKQMQYIEDLVGEIVAGCKTTDEKIKAVAVYLAENICYDIDYENGDSFLTNFDVYDVLKKGYTDAMGFANTLEVMLQLLDIPTSYAKSDDTEWVLAYNGKRWLQIDAAWMTNGVRVGGKNTPGESVEMDWYDFDLESRLAADDGYHCMEELALTVNIVNRTMEINGVIKSFEEHNLEVFPQYTTATEFTVPDGVTKIGNSAFDHCGQLTSITLPDSLTWIGGWAFSYCTGLDEIIFPDGLEMIEEYAFIYCDKITEVVIPDSVTYLGQKAFSYCTGLKSAVLSKEIPIINGHTFHHCTSLTDITLPDNLTQIYACAFMNCYSLTEIDIPDSVTYIGEQVFLNCTGLTEITIPDSVTMIDTEAFSSCTGLTKITLGNGLKTIGWRTFSGCIALTSITIPDSVETIEDEAFYYCESLKTVTLGKNLKTIGAFAFHNCDALTTVKFGNKLESIGEYAFEDCDALIKIELPDSVTSLGEYAFINCGALASVTLGEGLTTIPRYVFEYCHKLTSVKLGSAVTTIEEGAFYNCGIQSLRLPDTLTAIPDYAFTATDLTSIVIPKSVKTIGNYAFGACSDLETVYYTGTKTQWNAIEIDKLNDPLNNAKIIYNWQPAVVLDAPTLAASLNSSKKPALNWSAVENAEKYEVYYSTDPDGIFVKLWTGSGTKVTHNSAEEGVTYYYKVRALAGEEYSDFSAVKSVTCPVVLEVPTLTASNNAATGKVTLSWTQIDGAEKYEVYRSTSGKSGTFTKLWTGSGTKLTHSSAEVGKTYYYKVRVVAGDTKGEFSEVKSRTCDCARPTLTASNNAETGKIVLSWNKVDGAEKYEVWYSASKSGTYKKLWTGSSTKLTHNSAKEGVKYYYKVRAVSSVSTATGAYSAIVSRTVVQPLEAPVLTVSNNASTGKVTLSWNKVDGAEKYEIWYSTSKSGTYTRLWSGTGAFLTHNSAKVGVTYYYKVRAVNSSTESLYSTLKSRTCDCAKPTFSMSNDADTGKVFLSWSAVDGAVQYAVYCSTSKDGTYTKLATITDTSYLHTAGKAGETYYYKLQALGTVSTANSAYSTIKYRACDLPRPVLTVELNSDVKPVLRWNKVEGAVKYTVYRATSENGTYTKLWTGTGTKLTHNSAVSGETYYYKVVAVCSVSAGNSAYSEVQSVLCAEPLAAPALRVTINSLGYPVLQWGNVEGAEKYEIYRATSEKGPFELYKTTTGTAINDKETEFGAKYYYKVRAIAGQRSGYFSEILSGSRRLDAPSVTIELSSSGKPVLTWKTVTGADSYEIVRSTKSSSGYTTVWTGTALTWTDADAESGTEYFYKVKAIQSANTEANSKYSAVRSVTVE